MTGERGMWGREGSVVRGAGRREERGDKRGQQLHMYIYTYMQVANKVETIEQNEEEG